MHKQFLEKVAALAALAGILAFFAIAFLQLQVAFGWTNPAFTPPDGSGAIAVINGNIGIYTKQPTDTLSVNGTISAMGNLVRGVATPVAGTDAVNKDYLLAATANALTGPIVMYGVSSHSGIWPAAPGAGVPACPNGYSDLLYSPDYSAGATPGPMVAGGYGPHGSIFGWGWNSDSDGDGKLDRIQDPPTEHYLGATSYTYSVCSTAPFHYVNGNFGPGNLPGSQSALQFAPACTTVGNTTYCNTCRICGKYVPPAGP